MTAEGSDRSFGAPSFDIVLRGYDRRQVDEHLSRLNRVLGRMRGDLESARSHPAPPPGPPLPGSPPPGNRRRPTPRPRPDGSPGEPDDVVGTFTDRMRTILQAAEEEAAEIRAKARVSAQTERSATGPAPSRQEADAVRAELAHLVRQRDAVLADLARVRGQLEALLSGPTARITAPPQKAQAAARRDAAAGRPLPGTGTPAAGAPAVPPAERTTVMPAAPVAPAADRDDPDEPAAAGATPPGAASTVQVAAVRPAVGDDGPPDPTDPDPDDRAPAGHVSAVRPG